MQHNHAFSAAESLAVEERPEKVSSRKDSATTKKLEAAPSRPPLPVLTSLRFFAAAEVLVFHYFRGKISTSTFFWGLTSGGYSAVIFFFILSGFILTYVYWRANDEEQAFSALSFWKARFARIAPGYYLGILLSLPIIVYSGLISRTTSIPDMALGLTLAPMFLQAWSPQVCMLVNPPGWSLSVECFFYATFPLLLRTLTRTSYKYLLFTAYCLVIGAVLLRPMGGRPWNTFELYFPLYHLPEFLFGVALGRLYILRKSTALNFYAPLFFGSVAGLLLLFGFRSHLPSWTLSNMVLVSLFGAVILGGAGISRKGGILAHPLLVLLGEASFAIYILQWPMSFWWIWLSQKQLHLHLPIVADFATYSALVTLTSIGSFLYIEKPMRRRILGHTAHKAA